jgi:hypothetical protein
MRVNNQTCNGRFSRTQSAIPAPRPRRPHGCCPPPECRYRYPGTADPRLGARKRTTRPRNARFARFMETKSGLVCKIFSPTSRSAARWSFPPHRYASKNREHNKAATNYLAALDERCEQYGKSIGRLYGELKSALGMEAARREKLEESLAVIATLPQIFIDVLHGSRFDG